MCISTVCNCEDIGVNPFFLNHATSLHAWSLSGVVIEHAPNDLSRSAVPHYYDVHKV